MEQYDQQKKPKGFQKGHKDFVTKQGRISQSKKMRDYVNTEKAQSHLFQKGNKINLGRKREDMANEKHWAWKTDRTKLAKRQERNDSAYIDWRKKVWLRDNFACKIANPDCKGRIEAHHILGWSEYPELRYETNNGITLCHAHHPKKRAEEKRLSPYFQELVSVSN